MTLKKAKHLHDHCMQLTVRYYGIVPIAICIDEDGMTIGMSELIVDKK